MSNKLFVVLATFCAVLLATHTVSCEDVEVQQFDEVIPDSEVSDTVIFPLESSRGLLSPLLGIDDRNVVACNTRQCQQLCHSLGYRYGHCDRQARCICTN